MKKPLHRYLSTNSVQDSVLLHGLMREPTMHLTVHVRFFEMPIESTGFERMRGICRRHIPIP
ncbi:hypothetical protein T4A_1664 [Trichinella pseudospiralis]|uniref:Uncharacterized protein n=1 Tax=Trichinella pseudospiralis TaxID=6337 RepID=A0A0V1DSQ4_TRIPS|nr:hypothetical protein T4A_1664 [Trichinella pseudospiralis]